MSNASPVRRRWEAVTLVAVNLVPLAVASAARLVVADLVLAYVIEIGVGLALLVRRDRTRVRTAAVAAAVSAACVFAVVRVHRHAAWTVAGLGVSTALSVLLVIAGIWAYRRHDTGSQTLAAGRLVGQTAVVVLGAAIAVSALDHQTLTAAGWTPAVVDGSWWTVLGSGVALALDRVSDSIGIPSTAFPVVALIALKAFDEGWLAWNRPLLTREDV